jgi:general secretion pathway protein D
MEMEFLFKKSLRRLGMSITMIMLFSNPLLLAQASTDNTTVLQVKHNQAPALATRLESVLKDFGVSAQVTANRANNTLIVNGSSNAHKIAADLLRTLDKPATSQPAQVTKQSTSKVVGYNVPTDMLAETAQKIQAAFANQKEVKVVPDARTGQVVVIAGDLVHQQIAQYLASISNSARTAVQPVSGTAKPVHQLKSIGWKEFEASIQSMMGGKLNLSTNPTGEVASLAVPSRSGSGALLQVNRRTNTITIEGDAVARQAWLKITRLLDQPTTGKEERTGIVPVEKASPNTVNKAVALVENAEKAAGNDKGALRRTQNGKAWGGDLVSSIFNQDAVAQEDTVAQEGAPTADDSDDEIGETLLQIEPGEAGLIGPVQIEFVEGLGVFIIKGHRSDVARVIEIIEEIEQRTSETQPAIEIHNLKHVDSNVITELIEELYDDVFGARNSNVSITALDKPNALLLIGREESMSAIKDLIAKLDQPVRPDTQFDIFALKHMSALDAERQIRSFYTNQPGGDEEQRPGLGVRPRVIADYRTNSLIVHAAPRDVKEIAALLDRLDVEESPATNQLRVFRLKNALSADLQPVLQEAITGISANQGNQGGGQQGSTATISPQSSKLEILTITNEGESKVNSGILAGATVTADENVNALVVRAPATAMPLIEELITQLDQLPNAEAQIKVFQVENGDAINLTQLLQELFGLQVTAGSNASSNAFNNALSAGSGSIGGGESSLVPLRFAVDQRTNSVIASGSETDLDIVELLLIRLDEGDIETRRSEVIRLKNADASSVGQTLQTYVNTQRQLLTQSLSQQTSIANYEIEATEVVVAWDVASNSVIISAQPKTFDTLTALVDELDFEPDMVMIQVIIAEVELNDSFEAGVELGLQDSLLFDRGASTNGFAWHGQTLGNDPGATASSANLAGQVISGFGMGRNSAALGYGGLAVSAANESIHIMMRALQDRGRLQILSRPQLMTLDMTEGFVQVGSDIRQITGSQANQFGGITNTSEPVSIGLLINVRPRVTVDGRIVMVVGAEKSELGEASSGTVVGINPDGMAVMAAPINKTTAETVISARDGETVVFAGLITKDKAVARRSVPLLGDLPGLGSLFRYDVETEKRKELLIIMTPHIVRGEEDVDRIKALETERMSWLLSDLTEIHGDTGIKEGRGFWGEPGTVIYPDDDPAGTLLDHAFPSSSMGGGLPQLETNQLQSRYMFPRSGNPRMMQANPYNPQPPLPAPSQPAYQQRNAPVPQAPGDVSANPYLPANNVGGQRATNYTSQPQQPYNGQIRRVPPQSPQNYTTPISR